MAKQLFKTFYTNRPDPVGTILDTDTKFVDQSEADRCSLSYQLERFGMDGLLQKLEQTKSQFGYADTRLTKDFQQLSESLAEANSYFMQLPAQIRKEFDHDPIKFYSKIEQDPKYMYDKGYISEKLAKDLGVIKPVEVTPVELTPVTTVVTPTEPIINDKEVSAE